MGTRTGGFSIGFRRGGAWGKDTTAMASWAKEQGFDAIDLGEATEEDVRILRDHGLEVGTCDVLSMGDLFSSDSAKREETIRRNIEYIEKLASLDVHRLFTAVVVRNTSASRAENHAIAVDTFKQLAPAAEANGSQIVIEGWPGEYPFYPNLCCNPESYRRVLNDVGSSALGINYDPSHLIRMGIDHIRFLTEFVSHVGHVHGKDTEIFTEALYEYGMTQMSAFQAQYHCGENYWRYTIPGHGQARWVRAFQILAEAGWDGIVSVELEDHSFTGSLDAEKEGLRCAKIILETM